MKDIKYLARGRRSKVYTALYKNKKVAYKVSNRANKESSWLKILNKYKIGPKLIKQGKNYLIYELIIGDRILDYFKKYPNKIKRVIAEVLKQCRIMDKLKINKLEMHHPIKHIIIGKKVKMIDFERCYKTEKPKNVTQFCQFLMNRNLVKNKKGFRLLLRQYKNKQIEKNFRKILKEVKDS